MQTRTKQHSTHGSAREISQPVQLTYYYAAATEVRMIYEQRGTAAERKSVFLALIGAQETLAFNADKPPRQRMSCITKSCHRQFKLTLSTVHSPNSFIEYFGK